MMNRRPVVKRTQTAEIEIGFALLDDDGRDVTGYVTVARTEKSAIASGVAQQLPQLPPRLSLPRWALTRGDWEEIKAIADAAWKAWDDEQRRIGDAAASAAVRHSR